MRFFDRLNRIGDSAPVISHIVRFQNSVAYPLLYAVIVAIAGVSDIGVYVPLIYVMTALVVFSGIFSRDAKVFAVPVIMSYYAIGLDVAEGYYQEVCVPAVFDLGAIPHFIVCGVLMLSALIFRLVANRALKDALCKRGIFFWGIVALGAVIMANGAFSSTWQPINLLWGFVSSVALVVIYLLFSAILTGSRDTAAYSAKTLVICSLAVLAQIIVTLFRLHEFGNVLIETETAQILNRGMLNLSWGLSTIVGAVIAMGIPAAMYLARSRRFPAISYICALALLAGTAIVNTRSAMLCGGIMLGIGVIFCLIGGKNRVFNRIFTAVLALFAAVLAYLFFTHYSDSYRGIIRRVLDFLRFGFLSGSTTVEESLSGRADLWINGWQDFLGAIPFGAGFSEGGWADPEIVSTNAYSNMYHNIVIEFLGSMGVVGLLAFLVHLKNMLEVAARKFSLDRLLLLGVPVLIIAMSFFDSFFFYANFQLVYALFLAITEYDLERVRREALADVKRRESGSRPRVVFTYVEAGKGHIVPTRTVCEAFKKKYGDRAEIVESQFFRETDDEDMKKTELLFERAVQDQNRSPVMSVLCRVGNFIAGDAFALTALLSFSISGRKTCPLAVKHAQELDADVIFTAHWATPYYVNKIKGTRPRTVCFCPDVYPNGAFDVDCNAFLISSDVGYKRTCHRRMYAGGKVKRVPFPMRADVMEYAGEDGKSRARRELGIAGDAFVVTLCDGGYGMARLEDTVKSLIKSRERMTVIALCGVNEALHERLVGIKDEIPENITLIPLGFVDGVARYIAAADVFVGKSGANSMAEPCALGVPIIITKCITYIERGMKRHYVRHLGCARYVPSAARAAHLVERFAREPELLRKYADAAKRIGAGGFDAEAVADAVWAEVEKGSEA